MTHDRVSAPFGLSRRELLRRGAIAGAGVAGLGMLSGGSSAAASSSAPLAGTIEFLNYPQWIGPNEVKDFQRAHPKVTIKQNNSAFTGSVSGTALIVAQNPKQFDMLLADLPVVGQLLAGGFVAKLDFARIPNRSLIDKRFRDVYTHGIPTDFGKMGIGYRKDLVKPPPASWADLWAMAPKYKGKIVAYNLDRDMFGAALKYLGYSANTKSSAELQRAKNALIHIKPFIKAFKAVDIASELVKGSAAIAITNDYDVAFAQTQNNKIAWVTPKEGTSAYLEGWIGVSQSSHLDVVEALANFHLEPRNYASFVNATGTSYTESAARRYMNKAIASSPTIGIHDLSHVEFEQYLGPATTQLITTLWEQVQAA
jgi:spermidine/putrescine-binding protein